MRLLRALSPAHRLSPDIRRISCLFPGFSLIFSSSARRRQTRPDAFTGRSFAVIAMAAVLLVGAASGCRFTPRLPAEEQLAAYSDEPYRRVLAASVRDGLVDYAAIDSELNRELNRYLEAVASFGPKSTPDAFPTREDELAYYLNAYNAFMIRKWLDRGARTAGPDRNVGWLTWFTSEFWRIDGGRMSMDYLEQRLIRPRYDEPRIHFALVCGAASCPPLLDEPFTGERLDEQLDRVGRDWFAQPNCLLIDEDGRAWFSRIFLWYREDFDAMGGLAGVVRRYLDEGDPRREAALAALEAGDERFQAYDWSINKPPRR